MKSTIERVNSILAKVQVLEKEAAAKIAKKTLFKKTKLTYANNSIYRRQNMAEGIKKMKLSTNKIIAWVIVCLFVVGGVGTGIYFAMQPSLNLVGIYMDVSAIQNTENLGVAKKGEAESGSSLLNTIFFGSKQFAFAAGEDKKVKVWTDESTDVDGANNVEFVTITENSVAPISYYNARTDAEGYIKKFNMPEKWYISEYSITSQFIIVKFQYNHGEGVLYKPTNWSNQFGVKVVPIEFHLSNNKSHKIYAIDRNTGLISDLCKVMDNNGFLVEQKGLSTTQAGDMNLTEYDYGENQNYTIGMYRGGLYKLSLDQNNALVVAQLVKNSTLKTAMLTEISKYLEDYGNDETYRKLLNWATGSEQDNQYALENPNFYVASDGTIIVYFGTVVYDANSGNATIEYGIAFTTEGVQINTTNGFIITNNQFVAIP